MLAATQMTLTPFISRIFSTETFFITDPTPNSNHLYTFRKRLRQEKVNQANEIWNGRASQEGSLDVGKGVWEGSLEIIEEPFSMTIDSGEGWGGKKLPSPPVVTLEQPPKRARTPPKVNASQKGPDI